MFFDVYEKLCAEHNEKPYSLPLKLGAKSNSVVAQWKAGSLPRPEMLQKIADYFHVSVPYLMFGEEEKPAPAGEDELDEMLERLKTRPECRMLFKLADGATADDVKKAVAVIEALRSTEGQ